MTHFINIPSAKRELINNLNQQVRDLQNRNMELDQELSDTIEAGIAHVYELQGNIALQNRAIAVLQESNTELECQNVTLQEANRKLKAEIEDMTAGEDISGATTVVDDYPSPTIESLTIEVNDLVRRVSQLLSDRTKLERMVEDM